LWIFSAGPREKISSSFCHCHHNTLRRPGLFYYLTVIIDNNPINLAGLITGADKGKLFAGISLAQT
jgi:hypothetical protein